MFVSGLQCRLDTLKGSNYDIYKEKSLEIYSTF